MLPSVGRDCDQELGSAGLAARAVGVSYIRDALGKDLRHLIAAIDRDPPDLSVTDIRMPRGQRDEGLRAAAYSKRTIPRSPWSTTVL
jgi:hypothetical protein